jgi:phenylalanyl-tRNA synthetase beta subunit
VDALALYIPLGVLGFVRWLSWLIRRLPAVLYRPVINDHREPLTIVVPVYGEKPDVFREAIRSWLMNDVEEIICVAVIAPFVMNAWEKARNVDGKVRMLSDGNGDFTKALGMELDAARQRQLLESIACEVADADGALAVTPPAYRPDLVIEEDLYEEIARLHGYDKVPSTLQSSGTVGGRTVEHDARWAVRRALSGGGWTEALVMPFVSGEDADRLGWAADDPRRAAVGLRNPLSKEESQLRTSLLPGLLRAVRHNVNRQTVDLALFEVGRVFWQPTPGEPGADAGPGGAVLPAEPLLLGFAACGAFEAARHDREARPVDLYDVIGVVELAARAVGPALQSVHWPRTAPGQ